MKKQVPLVSVAMAIYNGERYMREQINSILNQTYSNIEVVVSDDKSTDATQSILEEYVKKDSRVKWSENPEPKGVARNFERAILACKGDVIFFADCDDVWDITKIARHMKQYEDQSVSWVYNRVELTDGEKKSLGFLEDAIPIYYTHKRNARENAWGACILGCATSYRADKVKKAFPLIPEAVAHDSWTQLMIWPAKSAYIPDILQIYRQHNNNDWGWNPERERQRSESELRRQLEIDISNNERLIIGIVRSNRVPMWKRIYFLFILIGKRLRRMFLSFAV